MGSPRLLCMTGGPARGMADRLATLTIAHRCYHDKSTWKKDLAIDTPDV